MDFPLLIHDPRGRQVGTSCRPATPQAIVGDDRATGSLAQQARKFLPNIHTAERFVQQDHRATLFRGCPAPLLDIDASTRDIDQLLRRLDFTRHFYRAVALSIDRHSQCYARWTQSMQISELRVAMAVISVGGRYQVFTDRTVRPYIV